MRVIWIFLVIILLTMSGFAYGDVFNKPFSNGSPACTSCHSIAAAGMTAKTWGPDISSIYEDFGGDAVEIKAFIKDSGIAPMDAVYKDTNLSDGELDELIKAFANLKISERSKTTNMLIFYAFALFVFLIIVGRFFFKKNTLLEDDR